jgi:hypothetical protein
MVKQIPDRKMTLSILLTLTALLLGFSVAKPSKTSLAAAGESVPTIVAQQECSKCEGKCKSWIDKCKDGGQYACYKAAACLCKCNLDAGGCGSSKEALQECYDKNEKLAKELEPSLDQTIEGIDGER